MLVVGRMLYFFTIALVFFSVRLLSVLRGRFSSLSQRRMTSDFKGFSIPDFIHYIYFPILILGKEPVFAFLMFSAKQGNYWYHFYNLFGMTWSLSGDCNLELQNFDFMDSCVSVLTIKHI